MASKPEANEASSAAIIIAALLLPPLGVYLARGLGASFWITAGLTCVAVVPGAIFALFTILRDKREPGLIA